MELAEINKRIDEIDGWFSYSQQAALYEIVKGLRPRSLIMEIGTYRGKSTLFYTLANPEVIVITNDICNYPWTTKLDPAGFELKNKPIDERVLHAGNVMQIIGRSSEIVKTWNLPIDFLFIDGKHSYENNIIPVQDFQVKYGNRIAVLGGIDINILGASSPAEVRSQTRFLVETCGSRGRYAIGSGNSIPSYIPPENYLAMVGEALKLSRTTAH